MSVVGSRCVQLSGPDVASFFYHTRRGLNRFVGAVYWLFRWRVTVPESVLLNHIWSMRDAVFTRSYLKSRKVAQVSPGCSAALPKQQYANSCAAQCLRQIACELGIQRIPQNRLYKFDGQVIDDPSAEGAIYGVTAGLLNERGDLKASLRRGLHSGGYSDPVGIKNAARLIGLDSRLYCASGLTDWYLKQSDPLGWKKIKDSCSVHRCSPPKLCSNERLIVLVCNYSVADRLFNCDRVLRDHYIVQRPDGSCYDPQTGKNHRSVHAYSASSGMKPNGIYMLISDKDSYA